MIPSRKNFKLTRHWLRSCFWNSLPSFLFRPPFYNFEGWLRAHLEHKEIGWPEIGEKFTRFVLAKTPWFNIYLHKLDARIWHPKCHDHPWGFVAVLIRKGYLEQVGDKVYRRRVGSILLRPATFTHNVITPFGTSWSIIFTTPKSRQWGFKPCEFQKVEKPESTIISPSMGAYPPNDLS